MTRDVAVHPPAGVQDEKEAAADPAPPVLQRRALVVLGMHRCGTSAVTRVLSLLGADLPGHLMKPVPGVNDSGFWESVKLADLNDDVLGSAGSSWDDVSEVASSWYASAAFPVFRDKAVTVLSREFAHSALFVLKDPRICKLVPFWLRSLKAFGAEPSFVIPIRNPLAAAASLKARDGFLPARSYLLWLRHLLEAERHTRDHSRCFVTYEHLLEDWRHVADRISRDLGLEWPRQSHQSGVEVEYFLSHSLRHHEFSAEEVESDREVPDWVKHAYRVAVEATRRQDTRLSETLDRIRAELNAADRIFGTLVAEGRYLASENEKLERKAKELEPLKAKVFRQHGEIERLGSDLAVMHEQTFALNQKIHLLNGHMKATREEVEYWHDRWKEAEEEVERLKREVSIRDTSIRTFQEEAARSEPGTEPNE